MYVPTASKIYALKNISLQASFTHIHMHQTSLRKVNVVVFLRVWCWSLHQKNGITLTQLKKQFSLAPALLCKLAAPNSELKIRFFKGKQGLNFTSVCHINSSWVWQQILLNFQTEISKHKQLDLLSWFTVNINLPM